MTTESQYCVCGAFGVSHTDDQHRELIARLQDRLSKVVMSDSLERMVEQCISDRTYLLSQRMKEDAASTGPSAEQKPVKPVAQREKEDGLSLPPRAGLRRFDFSGHQIYWQGYFHAFATRDGKPVAIVEFEGGKVSICDASGMRFFDDAPYQEPR